MSEHVIINKEKEGVTPGMAFMGFLMATATIGGIFFLPALYFLLHAHSFCFSCNFKKFNYFFVKTTQHFSIIFAISEPINFPYKLFLFF